MFSKNKGFTFTELIIAVLIITVVTGIVSVKFANNNNIAMDLFSEQDELILKNALEAKLDLVKDPDFLSEEEVVIEDQGFLDYLESIGETGDDLYQIILEELDDDYVILLGDDLDDSEMYIYSQITGNVYYYDEDGDNYIPDEGLDEYLHDITFNEESVFKGEERRIPVGIYELKGKIINTKEVAVTANDISIDVETSAVDETYNEFTADIEVESNDSFNVLIETTGDLEYFYIIESDTENIPPVVTLYVEVPSGDEPIYHYTYYDEDGDNMIDQEWVLNGGETLPFYPTVEPPNGTNTIEMRAQDSNGDWSGWVSDTFVYDNGDTEPEDPEEPEVPDDPDEPEEEGEFYITISPSTILDRDEVTIDYVYEGSENIKSIKWKLDNGGAKTYPPSGIYEQGVYEVTATISFTGGAKKITATKTFEVLGSYEPDLLIMVDPGLISKKSYITYTYEYNDVSNGEPIAEEWQLDEGDILSYAPNGIVSSAGYHTIKLRVQKDDYQWSGWSEKTFYVNNHISLKDYLLWLFGSN